MKTIADWTGHVREWAEGSEKIVRVQDWTGHTKVSEKPERRVDWQAWIGPGILAVALGYVCSIWGLATLLAGWLGEGWEWVQPLVMFLMIIPFPAIGFMVAVATGREGVMTPLGYLRWFWALKWGPSPDDSSSSDWESSSYDGGGSGSSGGGSFGGGGGGASW